MIHTHLGIPPDAETKWSVDGESDFEIAKKKKFFLNKFFLYLCTYIPGTIKWYNKKIQKFRKNLLMLKRKWHD